MLFDDISKKSIYILLAITLVVSIFGMANEEQMYSSLNWAISIVLSAFWTVYVVCLIKIVRGSGGKCIGVWGYVWRGFISKNISLFFTMIMWLLLFGKASPSVQFTVTICVAGILFTTVFVWLIFSSSRKEHLLYVLRFVGGY